MHTLNKYLIVLGKKKTNRQTMQLIVDPRIIAANGVSCGFIVFENISDNNLELASACRSFPNEKTKPQAVAKVAGIESRVTLLLAMTQTPGGGEGHTNKTRIPIINRVRTQPILPFGTNFGLCSTISAANERLHTHKKGKPFTNNGWLLASTTKLLARA